MNLRERLRSLDRSSDNVAQSVRREVLSLQAVADLLGGEIRENPKGAFVLVRSIHSLSEPHGNRALLSAAAMPGELIRRIAKNTVSADFRLAEALFFDTETTGLAGGSGTYVFLIGLGYIEEARFVIEQLFLPRLESEAAVLFYLQELAARRRGLVSFNGKAFDLPLIAARFIQNRQEPRLALHEHVDLLHASRRLWRGLFEDCSLGTLERHVLKFRRSGQDIPGAEIPQIYMDFLRYGAHDRLPSVLYHNRIDILSLLALAVELCEAVASPLHSQRSIDETERSARLHAETHSYAQAAKIYQGLLERPAAQPGRRAAYLFNYAAMQKKMGNFVLAHEAWKKLIETGQAPLETYLELAKYYEHQKRDYHEALAVTRKVLQILECRTWLSDAPENSLLEAVRHRERRLIKRMENKKAAR